MYELNTVKDFPILNIKESGERLVYLDNGATTQKPQSVIDAVAKYYENSNANPHRGVYELAARSTDIYESAKERVARFINAKSAKNIVFTKNATEAFNLLAYSYGMNNLKEGDEIVLSVSEHHANLVPWMMVAERTGAKLVYLYPEENGKYTEEELEKKIGPKTKILAFAVISNVLGIINPVKKAVELAHKYGAVAVIDGAQSVAHTVTDVQDLDADFFIFSAHKMYAPMGLGVLYGKQKLIEELPPFLTGGDMIQSVHENSVTFAKGSRKFEGGTCNVGATAGMTAALDYINKIGMENIIKHEKELKDYTFKQLEKFDFLKVYGDNCDEKIGLFSFTIDEIHPHDVATILDFQGVTVRAGHHCAQPLMDYLKIQSCSRASIGIYNTKEDIDAFIEGIKEVRRTLGYGA